MSALTTNEIFKTWFVEEKKNFLHYDNAPFEKLSNNMSSFYTYTHYLLICFIKLYLALVVFDFIRLCSCILID